MSVRDIIEATRPCPTCGSAYYEEYGSTREHLLLMEAVIEWLDKVEKWGPGEYSGMTYALDALDALIAYRRERGLL